MHLVALHQCAESCLVQLLPAKTASLCCTGTADQQKQQQQLEKLLSSAARMLPAPQWGLATAPSEPERPPLAIGNASALEQVGVAHHEWHHLVIVRYTYMLAHSQQQNCPQLLRMCNSRKH